MSQTFCFNKLKFCRSANEDLVCNQFDRVQVTLRLFPDGFKLWLSVNITAVPWPAGAPPYRSAAMKGSQDPDHYYLSESGMFSLDEKGLRVMETEILASVNRIKDRLSVWDSGVAA